MNCSNRLWHHRLQVVQRADTAAPSALDLRCPGAALAADSGGAEGSGAPAKVPPPSAVLELPVSQEVATWGLVCVRTI